jgi:hypothetical protein
VSPSETAPQKSRARALRIGAASATLLVVAGYAVTQYATSRTGPARCTVSADGGHKADYEIHPEQAANAATITAVGSQRRLPERAVTIALATAMQESALRNIEHGDRDSLGLFQQRPSQGWGSVRQIQDAVYATGKFYDHLVQIPGYSRLPLTVAAQRVQRSGYPQAYAKHETNAALLTAALTGRRAGAFNCTTGPAGGDGKAGSAARVRERLVKEFGEGVLPGQKQESRAPSQQRSQSAPRPADREAAFRTDRAAAAEGDASEVRIPVPRGRRGWELAHWALANAAELRIEQITYRDRAWDASSSEDGWHTVEEPADKGEPTVYVRLAKGQ